MGLLDLLGEAKDWAGADDCTIRGSGLSTVVTFSSGSFRQEYITPEHGSMTYAESLHWWAEYLATLATQFSTVVSQGFR